MKKLSTLRRKADKLIQEYYVPRNLRCLICPSPTHAMHHFIPKSQSNYLRYREENLIPLCQNHHFAHHTKGDTSIGAEIVLIKGQNWLDDLQTKRHIIQKVNKSFYEKVIKRLEEK